MKENLSTARCWYYYRGATGEGGGACQHKMLVPPIYTKTQGHSSAPTEKNIATPGRKHGF